MPVNKVHRKKSSRRKVVEIRKVGLSEIFWEIADYCGLLAMNRDKETLEKVFSFVALGWNAFILSILFLVFLNSKTFLRACLNPHLF